ncbi:ribbon-helix-helix protein, CopG family [Conexibacter arvalis]|uniref:Putative transcriptional regulator n=1 Tax=Conexibacter arvalis TaxID=912552 RepID=A0A840IBS1_9ACTN|nr:ribbon-helix-helix protein, CopG family [Conexibacter arvalis]MBB4662132.1 putative transcriptional regulator [Conexibacter arvalis]
MLTTTVRLDRDLMARVTLHAERLGIAKAALIRDATFAYVIGIETNDRLLREQVSDVLSQHAARLDRIEQFLARRGR